jgi:adenylate cyclase
MSLALIVTFPSDRHPDRVIIGSNFVDGSLVRPCETLISQSTPTDNRIGFTNFWADGDDVVRRAQFRVTFEQVRNLKTRSDSEAFRSIAAGALFKAGFAEDVPNDVDPHAIRFTAGPRQGFPPRSLFEIFVPTFWRQNYQSGEFFRDKIVIIGAEGNWQHDEHPTPFGNMPGAELHLNVINAALHQDLVRELTPFSNLICIGLAAFLAVLATALLRSPWVRLILVLAVGHGAVLTSLFCFNRESLYLPIMAPLAVFSVAVLFGLICDFTTERIEKMRVRRVLERYVSRDVVHELVDHPNAYRDSLGGVTKPVAILFSDIRAYSSVTARSAPEALVAQLNEYFSAMVDCVFQSGGTLDKFIGDALMASWGSLQSNGARPDAIASVEAALAMHERISCLNRNWVERGWPELRVGMAINYGEVVVGNIGSPQRMEFTLIRDAVNISWKLQELTKTNSADLIVSETVAALVADRFHLRSLGCATLDDSHQPCEIFTIGSAEEDAENKGILNDSWHAGVCLPNRSFPLGPRIPRHESTDLTQR